MHELYELKEKLCKELEEYGAKEMNAGSLDVVDKLAHTIKNLDKIIKAKEDEEYDSYASYGSYDMNREAYMRTNRGGPGSYARRRDGMGRYSRDKEMVMELRELMENAPDDKTRQEFKRFIQKIESI